MCQGNPEKQSYPVLKTELIFLDFGRNNQKCSTKTKNKKNLNLKKKFFFLILKN